MRTLTPHVDVGGAAHIASGEHNQVEDVANDAHGADDGQQEPIAVLPQRLRPRILHILEGKESVGELTWLKKGNSS